MNTELEKPPLLLRYFHKYYKSIDDGQIKDTIEPFTEDDVRELRRFERGAFIRAGLAGALTGLAVAMGALVVDYVDALGDNHITRFILNYPEVFITIIAILATIAEIVYLYVLGVRTIHELSERTEKTRLATIQDQNWEFNLTRLALEMPFSHDPVFGINPMREASPLKTLMIGLAYKAKISISTFVAKALVKRVLGRGAARGFIELVTVPIFAVWNVLIFMWVLRKVRMVLIGPRLIRELALLAFPNSDYTPTNDGFQESIATALGVLIVQKGELHPNAAMLLDYLMQSIELKEEKISDKREVLYEKISHLNPQDQLRLFRSCLLAAVLDGNYKKREEKLLADIATKLNLEWSTTEVKRYANSLKKSGWITDDSLRKQMTGLFHSANFKGNDVAKQ